VPAIRWRVQRERRRPFGDRSPAPEWPDPVGFPPPWPDRPWIYGVMVASANGVVAWRRADPNDDPVRAILGGGDRPDEQAVDRRHMRALRCFGDVAIGARTLREQPRLVQLPREPGEAPAPELYRFRTLHGLPREPRHVVYTLDGDLDLTLPVFNTEGVDVIAVTGPAGAERLRSRGADARNVGVVAEDTAAANGLERAHRRLFAERGVRYLDCEGGETILRALRGAGILDEVFVTVTDVDVDESAHAGVLRFFECEREGAALIAEGEFGRWRMRRWRFNPR